MDSLMFGLLMIRLHTLVSLRAKVRMIRVFNRSNSCTLNIKLSMMFYVCTRGEMIGLSSY
jgi:hypothetical protein